MKIRRALISVYDKTGIVLFAKSLSSLGIEIISTGGTSRELKKAGLRVKEVSTITKFPEMLDGRVKTLHPNLHAGLLARRDNPLDIKTLEKHAIKTIDLLVVNLYPFAEAVRLGKEDREIIEMIDIGGPTLLRAAAKNFKFVAAICDPLDYDRIAQELRSNSCELGEATRRALAAKVFTRTARYDGVIQSYFNQSTSVNGFLPQQLTLEFEKTQDLSYVEKPHQKEALYRDKKTSPSGILAAKQLHGKELSFNNILDLEAAFQMA